ncbi:hypothetical protein HAX54_017541 [Datura stramonium]|uniref:Uncharacterized protein n=1 Tax=Datura stramonium TaxID=4076 RepID=A0ABS8UNU0_DATST|nr:hypothetical protein [Datura stramonium]
MRRFYTSLIIHLPIPRLGLPAYECWLKSLHGIDTNGPGINLNGPIKGFTSFREVNLTAAAFNRTLWHSIASDIAFIHLDSFTLPLNPQQQELKEDTPYCLEWLNSKKSNSAVCVIDFRTFTVMTNEQLIEFNFLWIIRSDIVMVDSAILPPEFLVETKERGLL